MRLVRSGTSYISQDDMRQHFGLGGETQGDLEVRWLLNVAYMTLGRYPKDVPADLRAVAPGIPEAWYAASSRWIWPGSRTPSRT